MVEWSRIMVRLMIRGHPTIRTSLADKGASRYPPLVARRPTTGIEFVTCPRQI